MQNTLHSTVCVEKPRDTSGKKTHFFPQIFTTIGYLPPSTRLTSWTFWLFFFENIFLYSPVIATSATSQKLSDCASVFVFVLIRVAQIIAATRSHL